MDRSTSCSSRRIKNGHGSCQTRVHEGDQADPLFLSLLYQPGLLLSSYQDEKLRRSPQ